MSQVQFQIAKFKFRQYQNTTSFRHFAKFNAHQIFPLYGIMKRNVVYAVQVVLVNQSAFFSCVTIATYCTV